MHFDGKAIDPDSKGFAGDEFNHVELSFNGRSAAGGSCRKGILSGQPDLRGPQAIEVNDGAIIHQVGGE